MKPRPIVQIQAGLALSTAIVVIALAGVPAAWGVVFASGIGFVLSVGLAIRYRRLTKAREISKHRAERDRIMRACLVVGLGGPVVIASVVLVVVPTWHAPIEGAAAHIAVTAADAVFAAMLTSSFFDWYLIRAFRDGVVGPPACQVAHHDDETALYYAQAWVAHRTMAELIGWGGSTVVLVVSLVALQRSTKDPAWSGFFTYLAPAGAVYLGIGGYLAKRLRPVPQYSQQPSPGLGRWVEGTIIDAADNENEVEGLVLDVALGVGLQILPEPNGTTVKVPLAQASRLRTGTRVLCSERCERWIPNCERGLLEDERRAASEEEDGEPTSSKASPPPERPSEPLEAPTS